MVGGDTTARAVRSTGFKRYCNNSFEGHLRGLSGLHQHLATSAISILWAIYHSFTSMSPLETKLISHISCWQEKELSEKNEDVIETMNHFKEQLGKTDQSEKIRELNEKIVSLKIQISVSV